MTIITIKLFKYSRKSMSKARQGSTTAIYIRQTKLKNSCSDITLSFHNISLEIDITKFIQVQAENLKCYQLI